MNRRALLLCLAGIFVLGGVILGFVPRNLDNGLDDPVSCGSMFDPDTFTNSVIDDVSGSDTSGSCADERADMKPLVFGSFGLAAVALIVAVAIPSNGARSEP